MSRTKTYALIFTLIGAGTLVFSMATGLYLMGGLASAQPAPNYAVCHNGANEIVTGENSLQEHIDHGDILYHEVVEGEEPWDGCMVGDVTQLAAAIDDANLDLDTSTITLRPGTTFTLEDKLPAITSTIIIEGNGSTIDGGNGAFRIFGVVGPFSDPDFDGNLEINDLVMINGLAGDGGAIYNLDADLILNDSSISGSEAELGGGILNLIGTVTLNDSLITGNTATTGLFVPDHGGLGGGIHTNSAGAVTLNGSSSVSGNTADINGGGIYSVSGAPVTLNDCSRISGNTAGTSGGGVYKTGSVTLNDISSICGNNPDDTAP